MFMGRSIPSAQRIQQFARVLNSSNTGPRRAAQLKPVSKARPTSSPDPTESKTVLPQLRVKTLQMAVSENSDRAQRMPLAEVVSDCVKRWFQDTLREANNGDIAMQVLVGQMYSSGYGVAKDAQKVFVLIPLYCFYLVVLFYYHCFVFTYICALFVFVRCWILLND